MNFLNLSFENLKDIKGEIRYLHGGKNTGSGAFGLSETAELQIILPRSAGAKALFLEIVSEDFSEKHPPLEANLSDSDFISDVYTVSLDIKALGVGLYFYRLVIDTVAGRVFAYGNPYELYLSEECTGKYFQFSVINSKYSGASAFSGGVIYHIFVDRFSKLGNPEIREDARMVEDWYGNIPEYPEYPGAPLKNNTFFGGTLMGIADKLDYIKSLGTTLIYLSPIFESASNHKYDTGDYMKVDKMFGGDDGLKELIKKAGEMGIGILLDGVFNHTGADSIYFNRYGRYEALGAYQSKESPYYSWYDFKEFPDEYTCWWGIEILPRINPDSPSCSEYFAGRGGVIEHYASLGIAGMRLDVADELSDSFISKIKSKLAEINPKTILYGEVWEDASNKIAYGKRKKYFLGEELDGVMNYPVREGIIAFLRDKNPAPLKYALCEVMFNAPTHVQNLQMNLLGTHDTERIITALAGDNMDGVPNAVIRLARLTEEQKVLGVQLLKVAYTILATIPGIPSIFYGDEAGLEGYKDPFNRRTYPWGRECKELVEHYRIVGEIRKNPVYAKGSFKLLMLTDKVLVFERSYGGVKFITFVNNSHEEIALEFEMRAHMLLSCTYSKRTSIKPHTAEIIKTTTKNTFDII